MYIDTIFTNLRLVHISSTDKKRKNLKICSISFPLPFRPKAHSRKKFSVRWGVVTKEKMLIYKYCNVM